MTVHRTDIIKAQFFEQGATRRQAAGEFLCFACGDMQRFGELACQSPQNIPDRKEFTAGYDSRTISQKDAPRRQIGRAARRERVCDTVYNAVVTGSEKKK